MRVTHFKNHGHCRLDFMHFKAVENQGRTEGGFGKSMFQEVGLEGRRIRYDC